MRFRQPRLLIAAAAPGGGALAGPLHCVYRNYYTTQIIKLQRHVEV